MSQRLQLMLLMLLNLALMAINYFKRELMEIVSDFITAMMDTILILEFLNLTRRNEILVLLMKHIGLAVVLGIIGAGFKLLNDHNKYTMRHSTRNNEFKLRDTMDIETRPTTHNASLATVNTTVTRDEKLSENDQVQIIRQKFKDDKEMVPANSSNRNVENLAGFDLTWHPQSVISNIKQMMPWAASSTVINDAAENAESNAPVTVLDPVINAVANNNEKTAERQKLEPKIEVQPVDIPKIANDSTQNPAETVNTTLAGFASFALSNIAKQVGFFGKNESTDKTIQSINSKQKDLSEPLSVTKIEKNILAVDPIETKPLPNNPKVTEVKPSTKVAEPKPSTKAAEPKPSKKLNEAVQPVAIQIQNVDKDIPKKDEITSTRNISQPTEAKIENTKISGSEISKRIDKLFPALEKKDPLPAAKPTMTKKIVNPPEKPLEPSKVLKKPVVIPEILANPISEKKIDRKDPIYEREPIRVNANLKRENTDMTLTDAPTAGLHHQIGTNPPILKIENEPGAKTKQIANDSKNRDLKSQQHKIGTVEIPPIIEFKADNPITSTKESKKLPLTPDIVVRNSFEPPKSITYDSGLPSILEPVDWIKSMGLELMNTKEEIIPSNHLLVSKNSDQEIVLLDSSTGSSSNPPSFSSNKRIDTNDICSVEESKSRFSILKLFTRSKKAKSSEVTTTYNIHYGPGSAFRDPNAHGPKKNVRFTLPIMQIDENLAESDCTDENVEEITMEPSDSKQMLEDSELGSVSDLSQTTEEDKTVQNQLDENMHLNMQLLNKPSQYPHLEFQIMERIINDYTHEPFYLNIDNWVRAVVPTGKFAFLDEFDTQSPLKAPSISQSPPFGNHLEQTHAISNGNLEPVSINMSCSKLDEIPMAPIFTQNVVELVLYENLLTSLPTVMFPPLMHQLKVLNLSNNFLASLPVEIGQLKMLEFLYLRENRLTQVIHILT